MRHENGLAEGCTMGDSQTASHVERWSTWDYAVAAAYTALLIAPAPFFWAPPAWVWALMSLPGRPAVEYDAAWTFEIEVTGPTGNPVPTDPDPVVPRSWSTDSGVELVGGFNATREGNHLITVTSPNCPPRAASMIILPIN